MSTHLFGVSERQRATSRAPKALQLLALLLPLTVGASALIWWNGLLDPHEVIKLAVILFGVTGLAIVQALYSIRSADAPRPLPLIVFLALGGMLLSASISALFASNSALAWLGVAGSISGSAAVTFAAVIACIAASSLRAAGWKPGMNGVFGLYLGVMALAFVQRLGWIDVSPGGIAAKVFSPLGNEVMVGWVSVLILAVTLTKQDWPWSRWIVVGTGVTWLTWLDRSEMWMVLLAALVVSQLLQLLHQPTHRSRWSQAPVWVGAMIALILWLVPVPRSSATPVLAVASWSQSAAVTRAAWSESAVLGVGQGQWSTVFERIRPIEANLGPLFSLRFDVGANWWFTTSAQEGILGLLTRGFLLFVLCIHVLRLAMRDEDRVQDAVLLVAVVGMLSLVHPYSWLLVLGFVLLGYAAGDEYEWSPAVRRVSGGGMIVLGLVTGACLLMQMPRISADGYARQGYMAVNPEARVDALYQATQRASWVPEYAFALTQARAQYIVSLLQGSETTQDTLQTALVHGIEQAKRVTDRWPNSADMWMARGGVYLALAPVTQGADQFAIQAYQEGMKYAPQHPGFPLGIANVYMHRAEAAAPVGSAASTTKAVAEYRVEQRRLAAQWLQRALEKKPDDQGMLYAYAANLARAGDSESALPLFKALVDQEPERLDLGLEYASILALSGQYEIAIPFAQRISSADPLYGTSRRLLTDWYVATQDWANALSAWQSLPASEQAAPAFRTRLRELQSKVSATGRR